MEVAACRCGDEFKPCGACLLWRTCQSKRLVWCLEEEGQCCATCPVATYHLPGGYVTYVA